MSNACLFSEEELQRRLFHPIEYDTGLKAARRLLVTVLFISRRIPDVKK